MDCVISLDYDEPLVDLKGLIRSYVLDNWGIWITDTMLKTYSLLENTHLPKQVRKDLLQNLKDPYFLLQAQPQPAAIFNLKVLTQKGCQFIVNTCRKTYLAWATEKVLHDQNVPIVSYQYCRNNREKVDVVNRFGACFHVDDSVEALEAFTQTRHCAKVVAKLSRPWNEDLLHNDLIEVCGWIKEKQSNTTIQEAIAMAIN